MTTVVLAIAVLSLLITPSMFSQATASDIGGVSSTPSITPKNTCDSANCTGPSPVYTFRNAEVVQAGAGLRNAGQGIISLHVPTGSTLVKAILYWTILDNASKTGGPAHPFADQHASLNGHSITGTSIGSDVSPCWAPTNVFVYRADVTSLVSPLGINAITTATGVMNATSPWSLGTVLPTAESAHLIIVYSFPNSASTVQIFDDSNMATPFTFRGGSASVTLPIPSYAGAPAYVGYAFADGQLFGANDITKSFTWQTNSQVSPTTLAMGQIFGRDPSITSQASARGSLSDTTQYDLTGFVNTADTSATLGFTFGNDCLTQVAYTTQS